MLNITEKHKELATASTRIVNTRAILEIQDKNTKLWSTVAIYTENDNLISYTITVGTTSGGFGIGGTNSAVLNAVFIHRTYMPYGSRLRMQVRFVNPIDDTDFSNWIPLGEFYIDTIISMPMETTTVTAIDKMLQLEKNYKSKKAYPQNISNILTSIKDDNDLIIEQKELINDMLVLTFPLKGQTNLGTNLYFSYREMLGFISSLQAGNAYFDRNGILKFSDYQKNEMPVIYDKVFNFVEQSDAYSINNVVWEEDGIYTNKDTKAARNTVYFQNPLYALKGAKDTAVDNIKKVLVGKNVRALQITKQGTGFYDVGETVSVITGDTTSNIIIGGIKYSMSNGGFTETLYSLAKTESQSSYNSVSSFGTGSGAGDGGSQTTIMHTVNAAPVIISDAYKPIIEMQFSSTSGDSAIFVTLNPNISAEGDLNIKIIIDTQLYYEFTHHCIKGKNIISINYPLIDLPNGGHKIIIQMQSDTATGVFDNDSAYLTLIGNGILIEAKWDGTIQTKEDIAPIQLRTPLLHISDIKENLNIKTQISKRINISENISEIPLRIPKLIINGLDENIDIS